MTRTLTLTPAEWEALQRDRTTWIVREGGFAQTSEAFHDDINPRCRKNAHVPPAELVAAAAPCKRCDGARNLWWPGSDRSAPCGDCRITLVGECPNLTHCMDGEDDCSCSWADESGTVVTLGSAYADSDVQMIWRPGVPAEGTQWATLVAMLGFDPSADVGRYAMRVRLA